MRRGGRVRSMKWSCFLKLYAMGCEALKLIGDLVSEPMQMLFLGQI